MFCTLSLGVCEPETEFTCLDGSCINATWVCDEENDCFDGSDEQNCTCNVGQYQCANGDCIPENFRCDYIPDCTDNSDEVDGCVCDLDIEYECESGGCVNASWVCDGETDCFDGSDEDGCNATTMQPPTTGKGTWPAWFGQGHRQGGRAEAKGKIGGNWEDPCGQKKLATRLSVGQI